MDVSYGKDAFRVILPPLSETTDSEILSPDEQYPS